MAKCAEAGLAVFFSAGREAGASVGSESGGVALCRPAGAPCRQVLVSFCMMKILTACLDADL